MKLFKNKKRFETPVQKRSFKRHLGLSIGFWDLYSKIDTETGVNISQEMVHDIYDRIVILQKKNIVFEPSQEQYDTTLKVHMDRGVLIIYGLWNMNREETVDEIVGARFYPSGEEG